MKNKGFTLIELLAVIVILAVIALIAIPLIADVIENSKEGSAKSSAMGYVKAVDLYLATSKVDKNLPKIDDNTTLNVNDISDLINIKGSKPANGTITFDENIKVSQATLMIDGYIIEYDGHNYNIIGKDGTIYVSNISFNNQKVVLKVAGTMSLTPVIAPIDASNFNLDWKSSDENVVTVDNDGLLTAIAEGEATITVKTDNGKVAQCTVEVIPQKRYLFNQGDIESLTGGWSIVSYTYTSGAQAYIQNGYMYVKGANNDKQCSYGLRTNNMIDVSHYDKIKFTYYDGVRSGLVGGNYIIGHFDILDENLAAGVSNQASHGASGTEELDISKLNGSYYIDVIGYCNSGSMKVSYIWLE